MFQRVLNLLLISIFSYSLFVEYKKDKAPKNIESIQFLDSLREKKISTQLAKSLYDKNFKDFERDFNLFSRDLKFHLTRTSQATPESLEGFESYVKSNLPVLLRKENDISLGIKNFKEQVQSLRVKFSDNKWKQLTSIFKQISKTSLYARQSSDELFQKLTAIEGRLLEARRVTLKSKLQVKNKTLVENEIKDLNNRINLLRKVIPLATKLTKKYFKFDEDFYPWLDQAMVTVDRKKSPFNLQMLLMLIGIVLSFLSFIASFFTKKAQIVEIEIEKEVPGNEEIVGSFLRGELNDSSEDLKKMHHKYLLDTRLGELFSIKSPISLSLFGKEEKPLWQSYMALNGGKTKFQLGSLDDVNAILPKEGQATIDWKDKKVNLHRINLQNDNFFVLIQEIKVKKESQVDLTQLKKSFMEIKHSWMAYLYDLENSEIEDIEALELYNSRMLEALNKSFEYILEVDKTKRKTEASSEA